MTLALSLTGVGMGKTELNYKKLVFIESLEEGACLHFLSDNSFTMTLVEMEW